MATLLFDFSSTNPFDVQLEEGTDYPVGRESDNVIVIADASVSAHHAWFRWTSDGWYLEDLHSANGTFVNSRRVSYGKLGNGCVIQFGKVAVEFLDDEFAFQATSSSFFGGVRNWHGVATWTSIRFEDKKSGEVIEIPFKTAPQAITIGLEVPR